ncbi:MAG: hypothetical protein CMJ40_06855, partial [Phycisphaerae bacterium]|nr:hypothetical protein [Phycisphaerae bacterium]
ISDCGIFGNSASVDVGGGIYCYSSNPSITGCTITGNTSYHDGGGIYCYDSSPTILDCTISGNTPDNIVGASAAILRGETGPSIITLENSTICGTGEHIKGVLIEHRGENHISDCVDEGDLNGDGAVDTNDLAQLRGSLGLCASDTDMDGDTDIEDLLNVVAGWGTTCNP